MSNSASRFELQLEDALKTCKAKFASELESFWLAWEAEKGARFNDLIDFRAAMADPTGPIVVLDRCHGMLTGKQGQPFARGLDDGIKALLKSLLLATVERYIQSSGVPFTVEANGVLVTQVAQPLTAWLMAAVHGRCGLRLVYHDQSNAAEPMNLLVDPPAAEFGDADATLMAWGKELLQWCETVRANPNDWLNKGRMREAAKLKGAINPLGIKLALDRVARELHIRPMIAVTLHGDHSLVQHPDVLAKINHSFGTVSAFAQSNPQPLTPNPQTNELEDTLEHYVNSVLQALNPTSDTAGTHGAQGALARGQVSQRTAFICYSRLDGEPYRKKIETFIGGIPDSAWWSDSRIELGNLWRQEIDHALSNAACAVLILTPGFLDSKFIKEVELPRLLLRSRSAGVPILAVQAEYCNWERHEKLEPLQIVCDKVSLKELAALANDADGKVLKELAAQIGDILNKNPRGN